MSSDHNSDGGDGAWDFNVEDSGSCGNGIGVVGSIANDSGCDSNGAGSRCSSDDNFWDDGGAFITDVDSVGGGDNGGGGCDDDDGDDSHIYSFKIYIYEFILAAMLIVCNNLLREAAMIKI